MNGKNIYEFYRKHVPNNINEHIRNNNYEIETRRQNIVVRQRFINIYRLRHTECPKYAPTPKELDKYIFKQHILSADEIASDIVQNASLLIPQIYSDLESFANAVISASHGNSVLKKNYMYIIDSIVPMVFGYFSAAEFVENAVMFYTHIIGKAKPYKAAQVLRAFFRGLPTFRYVEHVMSKFAIKFGSEIRLKEIALSNLSYSNISTQFFEYLDTAIPLLPPQHILLINIMHDMGWTPEMLVYFFFQTFFIYEAERWIEASPYANHKDLFLQILKNILDPKKMAQTVSHILETTSSYECPYLYQPFSHKYLNLIVTSYDIKLVTKLLKSVDRLSYDYQYKIPHSILYLPYWIRVYPTFEKFDMSVDNLIFHHSDECKDFLAGFKSEFEKDRMFSYIESTIHVPGDTVFDKIDSDEKYKISETDDRNERNEFYKSFYAYSMKKSLIKLKGLADKFELFLYQKIFTNSLLDFDDLSTQQYNVTYGLATITYKRYSFLSEKLILTSNLIQLEPLLEKVFKQYQTKFVKITKTWAKFAESVKGKPISMKFKELPRGRQIIFWECVEQLRNLTNIPYFLRFEVLCQVFLKIELISSQNFSTRAPSSYLANDYSSNSFIPNPKRMDFLITTLIATENNRILITLLLFSTCLLKNEEFRPLISDDTIDLWTIFESVFLKAITSSDNSRLKKLSKLCIELQIDLDEEMKQIDFQRYKVIRQNVSVSPSTSQDSISTQDSQHGREADIATSEPNSHKNDNSKSPKIHHENVST